MNILLASITEEGFYFGDGFKSENEVIYASDLDQALAFIDNNCVLDILVIDMDDYGDQGLDLIEKVRETIYGEDLFIILITSEETMSYEAKGLSLGADEYIRRPMKKESFEAVLRLYEKFIFQRSEKNRFMELAMVYDALFQQAPIGISLSHSDKPLKGEAHEYFETNKNYLEITGRTHEELLETGWYAITHPEDRDKEAALYKEMQEGRTDGYELEKRFIRPDGSIVWVHLVATALELEAYSENSHICILQDITERKEAEEALDASERTKGILISNLPGIAYRCKIDEDWTMESLSEKSKDILGYDPDELINNANISYNDLILPEYRGMVKAQWADSYRRGKPLDISYKVRTKDGQEKWMHEAAEGVVGESGEVEHIEGMIFDDSERRRIEDDLKFITEHRVWTGLYNRRYFDKFYSEKNVNGNKNALILINLSKLLTLNMSYGYSYYRDIVRGIGTTLSAFVEEDKHLFHIAENLFILYLDKYEDKAELETFAQKVSKALEDLLALELIGGGMGIVEIEKNDFDDLDRIISNALIASEESTPDSGGRISYSFFDSEMENHLLRKELIKQELAKVAAGENKERLFLEFQPIINLKDNDNIWAFEALARFNSDTLGRLSPLEFIPIAEETKLIIPLGEQIIDQAFDFQNLMEAEGYANVKLNINLSAIQLRESGFCDKIILAAEKKNICLSKVTFELTESALVENYRELNHSLTRLIDKGASVAIDDFGTGYSSLARERELNVSYMKTDKYFMDKMLTLESFEDSLIGDIISMAHKLDNYVVAEGVEHLSQMEFLKMKGCDGLQGFLISRPLGQKDAIAFMGDYLARR